MAQLRGELEKGSEMLKRDSELQQKESVLLEARQDLEGMQVRAEEAEAALRPKRDAFEEVRGAALMT